MLKISTVLLTPCWSMIVILQYHSQLVTSAGIRPTEDVNAIIWNGCESQAMMNFYPSAITIEKPDLCSKRLPDYLDGIKPQSTQAPYLLKVMKCIDCPGDFLIFLSDRSVNRTGKSLIAESSKYLTFESILISAQTPEGMDTGEFLISDEGAEKYFDIGYCCGESRNTYNFYQYQSLDDHFFPGVFWKSNFKGRVVFNATVIRNSKANWYWYLPPKVMDID